MDSPIEDISQEGDQRHQSGGSGRDGPTSRLRQFRCTYPGCPSSRTNKRNNVERHVFTQHVRVDLGMPEARYFARYYKHHVEKYVTEVTDGKLRQRGRRARSNQPRRDSESNTDSGDDQNDVESSIDEAETPETLTDGPTPGPHSSSEMGTPVPKHDIGTPRSPSAHSVPSVTFDMRTHHIEPHPDVPRPYAYSPSGAIPSAAETSKALVPPQPYPHLSAEQGSKREYPSLHMPPMFTTAPTKTSTKSSVFANSVTQYGEAFPLPPVGSSLITIERPSEPVTAPPTPSPQTTSYACYGPLAPLLLALQAMDSTEPAAPQQHHHGTYQGAHYQPSTSGAPALEDHSSVWRPWMQAAAGTGR